MTKPSLTIEYCVPCDFLPRTVWHLTEINKSFGESLAAVTLIPGSGGVYNVALDGATLFSKDSAGRFPEPEELLQASGAAIQAPSN